MRIWVLSFVLLLFSTGALAQHQPWQRVAPDLAHKISLLSGDSVWVSVSILPHFTALEAVKRRYRLETITANSVYKAKLALKEIQTLSLSPGIIFISEILLPCEELTTGAYDLTLNRVNFAQARFPDFNGIGLKVSVKERLFDPADIDMRGRIFTTGHEATFLTSHAALMATMIAGGANSSPFARGIAWRSHVTSSNFANLFPDPDTVFSQHNISVQNHSYGTIVENFYGNEAMAYDRQANDLPTLLHVFSSGNSGTATPAHGAYAGINGFANLTGNFKQAKNVLTVGSVDSSGQLMPLSSRGPAFDGRIKPELVAYGEDGSSGAAATISGVALLIQNAFHSQYNSMPPASLLKAVLINSADDAGPAHPDYITGFGNLNAYRSLNTIMQNRFALNNLQGNDTVHIPLNIGNNIARIKISLCWNDPAANAGAAKALVRQLDMQLMNEDGSQTWLPWVLDSAPNMAALQLPATRKKDTLNNIEQITVEFPANGVYDIQVMGDNISGLQDFAVTWQLDTVQHFYWTYPVHTDQLIAGNTHWLRWTTNRHAPAQIEYVTETDNWRLAGQVADASLGYFKWRLPDTIASARLRMHFIDSTINSETFTISPQLNLQVGYNCADSFLLYWNKVHNGSYSLYQLGDQYLEPFMQVSDTFIILNKQDHPSIYYTVAPQIQGKPGIKANTVNYPSLGPACYINAFYLQSQVDGTAFFNVDLGTIFGIGEMAIEKQTAQGFQVVQLHAQPPGQSFIWTVPGLTPGENHYRLRIKTTGGVYVYSNVEIVYFWLTEPVLVYPNPVRRGETIKLLTNESGRFTIKLVNAYGSLLHQQPLYSTRTEILTYAYAPGIYWISIFDRDGKSLQKKILIQ